MVVLQIVTASVVLIVWASVAIAATFTRDAGLIGLASTITPIMLAVVGWFSLGAYLTSRRRSNGHE